MTDTLTSCVHDSPVGPLTLIAHETALVAVLWPDERDGRVRLASEPRVVDAHHPVLAEAVRQLSEYFAGDRRDFELGLDPQGTDFQRDVWWSLADIPFGETSTYGRQAELIGRPRAVRAVGSANGRNPLSIVLHAIASSQPMAAWPDSPAVSRPSGGYSTTNDGLRSD